MHLSVMMQLGPLPGNLSFSRMDIVKSEDAEGLLSILKEIIERLEQKIANWEVYKKPLKSNDEIRDGARAGPNIWVWWPCFENNDREPEWWTELATRGAKDHGDELYKEAKRQINRRNPFY